MIFTKKRNKNRFAIFEIYYAQLFLGYKKKLQKE